ELTAGVYEQRLVVRVREGPRVTGADDRPLPADVPALRCDAVPVGEKHVRLPRARVQRRAAVLGALGPQPFDVRSRRQRYRQRLHVAVLSAAVVAGGPVAAAPSVSRVAL